MTDVTHILSQIEAGDPSAAEQLLPLVYEELRILASAKMASERNQHTLQGTALVHEAYLRLVDTEKVQQWDSRGHFFAAAAEAMRRILVENARKKNRVRHGGAWNRVELLDPAAPADDEKILALDEALDRLAREDSLAARVVELHFFAKLSHEQAADALCETVYLVRKKWTYAQAWLSDALADSE